MNLSGPLTVSHFKRNYTLYVCYNILLTSLVVKHHVKKCDVLSSAKRIANQEYAALSSVQSIQIPMELSDGTMSRCLSVHMIPLVRVTNVDALEKRLGAFAIASVEPESDVNLLIDGNKVGTARVAGKDGQFRVELHGTNLEEMQRCGQKLVSVTSCQFSEEFGNKPFPYLVPGPEDPPRTLSEVYKTGYYTWDLHAMSVL